VTPITKTIKNLTEFNQKSYHIVKILTISKILKDQTYFFLEILLLHIIVAA